MKYFEATKEVANNCITRFTIRDTGYTFDRKNCKTTIGIKDLACTYFDIDVNVGSDKKIIHAENVSDLEITFTGDAERENLIDGLKFILQQLETNSL